jgi:hypothetical protein
MPCPIGLLSPIEAGIHPALKGSQLNPKPAVTQGFILD